MSNPRTLKEMVAEAQSVLGEAVEAAVALNMMADTNRPPDEMTRIGAFTIVHEVLMARLEEALDKLSVVTDQLNRAGEP